MPDGTVAIQPLEVSGAAAAEKLETVRRKLTDKGANATVVTALDEIMWLFNIRGAPADIDYNPVIMSYAVVTVEPPTATLWVDPQKLDDAVLSHLSGLAELNPYTGAVPEIAQLLTTMGAEDEPITVLLDKVSCNLAVHTLLTEAKGIEVLEEKSVLILPKALKTQAEIDGYFACHLRDGSALTAFFCWLEHHVVELGETHHTEWTVGERVRECREALDGFRDLSFGSIAGYGPNGALPHYSAHDDGTARTLVKEGMFLLDSGGQYIDGTTDTTRTHYLGNEPTEHQRRCFTRVLQGHIDLASATFPEGTTGQQLDLLARVALWRDGLEYHHGTGHGVGSFLNVHESGSIYGFTSGANPPPGMVPLQAGMVITNEPGYYEEGNFGVRTENVYLISRCDDGQNSLGQEFADESARSDSHAGDFLKFEPFTRSPIQTKLVLAELLSVEQRTWINEYNAKVRAELLEVYENTPPERFAAWQVTKKQLINFLLKETEPVPEVAVARL